MGLTGCMQGAPFILVGYRLMSHMYLLMYVCVEASECVSGQMCLCVTYSLMCVIRCLLEKHPLGKGNVINVCVLKCGSVF